MLWWVIMLVFGLPLVKYLIELYDDKKATNHKLEKIKKRLKEIEERDAKKKSTNE